MIPLGFVDEPRQAGSRAPSLAGHLRQIPALMRADRRFGLYVLMQATLQFALSGIAFVTGYAVLELGAAEGVIAVGSALVLASEALGSLLLGRVADRLGCKPAFVVSAACGVALYGLMAFSPPIAAVLAAYVLVGLFQSGFVVGNNMTMELAPPGRTATFSAVVFSTTAAVRIAGPLALGVLADAAGTRPVFAIVALACGFALYLAAFRLEDPRRVSPARS